MTRIQPPALCPESLPRAEWLSLFALCLHRLPAGVTVTANQPSGSWLCHGLHLSRYTTCAHYTFVITILHSFLVIDIKFGSFGEWGVFLGRLCLSLDVSPV